MGADDCGRERLLQNNRGAERGAASHFARIKPIGGNRRVKANCIGRIGVKHLLDDAGVCGKRTALRFRIRRSDQLNSEVTTFAALNS